MKEDVLVMKLLHYFITDKNYNPVILHGVKDEIWLENLEGDYKIIRIVSNYIHNNEQLEMDLYKTNHIMKSIKKKTFSLRMNVLSIFLNLGDNVKLEENYDYVTCLKMTNEKDIIKNNTILSVFPDITKINEYKEEGLELFLKLNEQINNKTNMDAKKAEEIFKPKKIIITKALIIINIIIFILMYILGNGSNDVKTLLAFGANNRYLVLELNQYYRLFTSSFIHIGIFHLFVNMYSLYAIGSQIENFYGKKKYLVIYIGSAIIGSLLSICFFDGVSAGASGAIFGLLGSILYFGYHYRIYLGNTLKTQIIPIIILNLLVGNLLTGIDNIAHIGGLIAGLLLSMAVGVNYKSKKTDKLNGFILLIMFLIFIAYLLTQI